MAHLTAAAQTGPPKSAVFDADVDVLAFTGLALLDDPGLPRPRFGDDRWDLSAIAAIPAYARIPSALRVDWTTVVNPVWRLCAKELGLALLQPDVGLYWRLPDARRRPLPPHQLTALVSQWRGWFDWLERHQVDRLAGVTQAHCDAWLAGRREEIQPSTLVDEVIKVRQFADYRQILSLDSYRDGFRPWSNQTASKVAGSRRRGENTTQVIPDEVFGPLLAAALFMVDMAGPDVIAAQAESSRLQRSTPRSEPVDDLLRRHLGDLRRSGQPLPAVHPAHLDRHLAKGILDRTDPLHRVNMRMIERRIGANYGTLTHLNPGRRSMLESALEELGCAGGGLTTPVGLVTDPANPDHRHPWHEPFSPYDLEPLAQMIRTGCYIVVAALSGLRRSELAEMRRGCVRAEELANGKLRYRIHTKLIKGQPLGGTDERWTVIEQVAQAFSIAEQLTERDHPFARMHLQVRYPKLRNWTNTTGVDAFLDPIPAWTIGNQQFRRTLARLLGFRPHGVIAGKIHLKHVSVVTSEGYYGRAGSSAAAFLAEVEQETARARLETTKRLYADWVAGQPIAGPGRAELTKLFTDVHADMSPFEGTVLESDRRLENLLRRRANTLHVGPLNNCWFVDPGRALCLKQSGRTDATAPLIGMCESTRCPNATEHPEHVRVWINHDHHVDKLLANPRIPKHEKERLALEKTRIRAVVEGLGGDTQP
jgi:hypothetical protein